MTISPKRYSAQALLRPLSATPPFHLRSTPPTFATSSAKSLPPHFCIDTTLLSTSLALLLSHPLRADSPPH